MRILTKLCVLAASVAISTSAAYATTLGTGSINLAGGDTYTSNSIHFTGAGNEVVSSSGSLAAFTNGSAVVFDSINSISSFAGATLFTVNNGIDTLTYYLSSITTFTENSTALSLIGDGYFTETLDSNHSVVATSTPGVINISSQNGGMCNENVSFSATSSVTPEPSSLLLLGTGLLGAAGIARRKFASKLV